VGINDATRVWGGGDTLKTIRKARSEENSHESHSVLFTEQAW